MIEFFNAKMQEAKLNTAPGNPVIAAQINLEQNFAFIEVHCYGLVSFLGICLFAGICVFYMIGTTYTCINGLKLKLSSAKSDNKGKIAEEKATIAGHLSSNSCYIHLYCCHLFVNPVMLLVEVVLIRSFYVLNVECTCLVCVFNLKHTIYSAVFTHLLFSQTYQLRSVEETTQAMAFDGIILEVQFRKCCSLVLANLMSMNTSGKNLTTVTINLMVTLKGR